MLLQVVDRTLHFGTFLFCLFILLWIFSQILKREDFR